LQNFACGPAKEDPKLNSVSGKIVLNQYGLLLQHKRHLQLRDLSSTLIKRHAGFTILLFFLWMPSSGVKQHFSTCKAVKRAASGYH
jgi:hypothetical protein